MRTKRRMNVVAVAPSSCSAPPTSTSRSTSTPLRLTWLVMLVFYSIMMYYALFMALTYLLVSTPMLEFTREIYNLPGAVAMQLIAVAFLLLTIGYGVQAWRMVHGSLQLKRLVFNRTIAMKPPSEGSQGRRREVPRFLSTSLLVRQLLEMLALSYQGYWLSRRSPNVMINWISTVLLMTNCWSGPLLQLVCRSVDPVTILACDLVVDFMTAVLIRFLLVFQYRNAFDAARFFWKDEVIGDSVFFVGFDMEIQLICVTTVWDFIATMIPLVGMLLCAHGINQMLQRRVNTIQEQSQRRKQQPEVSIVISGQSSRHHLMFAVWGFGVLVFQLMANSIASGIQDVWCLVPLRPWFTSQQSCALVLIDCHALGLNGSVDIAAQWMRWNPEDVVSLEIRHCPALIMPPEIQQLRMLGMIDLFNNTIVEWNQLAALTSYTHPHLRLLMIYQTNTTETTGIPAGLRHDLPPSLRSINWCGSNLTTLPSDLASAWSSVKYLSLERGVLQEWPSVLWEMEQLDILDVSHNHIERMEAPDQPNTSFVYLRIGKNPIPALPESIGEVSQLVWLSFDETQVAFIPSWVEQLSLLHQTVIYGTGSSYCQNQSQVTHIECHAPNPQANLYDPYVQKKALVHVPP